MTLWLGCIADDFTGATDLASNLVQAGMRTVQTLGIPATDSPILADADALVVALKTRTVHRNDAIRQSLEACRALRALGAQRLYFKYCSTFDSTENGNIGPVAEALLDASGGMQTIFCPAFPDNGRTVYQGHLFVHDRLLSESGMERHPLNPMTDANLCRVLARQASRPVGLVDSQTIDRGMAAVRTRLQALRESGQPLVIVDTLSNEHLRVVASAVADFPLLTGGSGLALGLPVAYRDRGELQTDPMAPRLPQVGGRTAILSGSCSQATQQQVSRMKDRCPSKSLNVRECVARPDAAVEEIIRWARETDGRQPILVYSTATPDAVAEFQAELGRDAAARAVEDAFANVAFRLVTELNIRRWIVAGGETAGAVVSRLGVQALRIGPPIAPGVPWTETIGDRPLALALKSGNFGGPDFFRSAVEMLP